MCSLVLYPIGAEVLRRASLSGPYLHDSVGDIASMKHPASLLAEPWLSPDGAIRLSRDQYGGSLCNRAGHIAHGFFAFRTPDTERSCPNCLESFHAHIYSGFCAVYTYGLR